MFSLIPLQWKSKNYANHYAKLTIKGMFGLRFNVKKVNPWAINDNTDWVYEYIVNGKHYGNFLCDSLEDGINKCNDIYVEIMECVLGKIITFENGSVINVISPKSECVKSKIKY